MPEPLSRSDQNLSRSLVRRIGVAHVALVVSLGGLAFTAYSAHNQRKEAEMQLWAGLRQEFDYTLVNDRIACGKAYKDGTLEAEYGRVMDYFETVGFLVRTGRLDDDLFKETWGYYFSGYFQATKAYLERERATDKTVYQGVYYLEEQFGPDRTLQTPADLKSFFEDEERIPR
jgi:hypothetical protein